MGWIFSFIFCTLVLSQDVRSQVIRPNFPPAGQNFRPAGQNFQSFGQNLQPNGQNFQQNGQNFQQNGQNFQQNGQNFQPIGQNFPQSNQNIGQNDIRAFFSMTGVAGDIEFRPAGFNQTRAIISITTSQWFRWEIREFPVMTTEKNACDDIKLGRVIRDLSTFLNVIDSRVRQGETVDLRGVSLTDGTNAILGRTLLLKNGNKRACATIQGPEPLSFARVQGPISGKIHIRQVGNQYAVFTDLFSTKSSVAKQTALRLYRGNITVDLPQAQSQSVDVRRRCSYVSGMNMVSQIINVPVAAAGSSTRFMIHVQPNVNAIDILSGWLKIGSNADTSCANLHLYESKTVQAVFSRDGVNGFMVFKQDNPYKPTMVQVDLQKLNNRAGGYHVHLFPLPYEFSMSTNLCGSDVTSGHFNPFNKPARGGTTQEEFELGDLSNKHGSLANRRDINQTYTDLYLPLFGKHSIVGRSVVIHSPTGTRWMCANIGYPGPVTVAKAEFNGDVEGTITFVQEENKPWADTALFIEMSDAGETIQTTFNHNYHIHTNPVGNDYLAKTRRCASTGGHWNPFNAPVTDSRVYIPTCAANRLGCEVGDLSNKYNETINIAAGQTSAKYFYTDNIPLSGAYSVIKRSVTIHQQQKAAARYVCADIVKKLTPVITTENRWHGAGRSSDTTTGKVMMSSTGLNSAITSLVVSFNGLNNKAGMYHINELPLGTLQQGNNICDTTGQHYNPLRAMKWQQSDSLDHYEVGDLSTKFGLLANRQAYRLQTVDTNLPLGGAYSVAGRSVVIHDSSSPPAKWKCTNLIWDTRAMNGTLLRAKANFVGEIQGYIEMSQVVAIDGESEVSIEIVLWYTNRQQPTTNHNWHIHESSIQNNNCATSGPHYNPFLKKTGAASYRSCGVQTPRKCEMGDMAGKFGRIDIGTRAKPSRYVFNDNFLTLNGKFSVLGKSIVIHSANQGAAKVACADLAPTGQSTQVIQFFMRAGTNSVTSKLQNAIKSQLNTDQYHNVYVKAGAQKGGCTPVSVHFTGARAAELKNSFNPGAVVDQSVNADSCNGAIGQTYLPGLLFILMAVLSI